MMVIKSFFIRSIFIDMSSCLKMYINTNVLGLYIWIWPLGTQIINEYKLIFLRNGILKFVRANSIGMINNQTAMIQ